MGLVGRAAYTDRQFDVPWSHFVDVYMAKHDSFISSTSKPTSLEEELAYQQALVPVERSSWDEMVRVKLFDGVRTENLTNQAQSANVFPHGVQFIKRAVDKGIPVYILSVNWTSKIMKEILRKHGVCPSKVHFITNELETVDDVLTGDAQGGVHTGSDKLHQFMQIKRKYPDKKVYYIGDSASDLLCILEADCGIAFGDGSALSKLQQYEIPYDEGSQGHSRYKHIQSWDQLAALLD